MRLFLALALSNGEPDGTLHPRIEASLDSTVDIPGKAVVIMVTAEGTLLSPTPGPCVGRGDMLKPSSSATST